MKRKSLYLIGLVFLTSLVSCNQNTSSNFSSSFNSSESSNSIQSSFSTSSVSSISLKDKYNCISIKEALDICSKLGENETSTERYYIYGTIKSISSYQYGSMIIKDDESEIEVYGVYSDDGSKRYNELDYKVDVNDQVVLYANLCNFKSSSSSTSVLEIKSGWLIDYEKSNVEFDTSSYKKMSILESRDASKGEKVIVSGVVSKITQANGGASSGFYLIDNTSSIYIFDKAVASKVSVGNTVSVAASKDYWILEKEKTNAAKYGYNGACQLVDAHLLSNDNLNSNFDTTWIENTTIKDILNTPVSENITNKVYKVDALVVKKEASDHTNYYFYDIDGKTGSYTYTNYNGKDYAYLDEFDGKICSTYITCINAVSSSSGCMFRFVPIKVEDNNYTFDKSKVNQYVYDYEIEPLLKNEYNNDPSLELPLSVSSSLLGFENASVSYTSSDENILSFETKDTTSVMHLNNYGEADITIKINYLDNQELVKTYKVKYSQASKVETISVNDAILTEDDKTVNVKGVVGAYLVNKCGFYLIDETGIIAVQVSSAEFENINRGDQVIISGTRTTFTQNGDAQGEIVIKDATLVENLYGDNSYSTASFDSTKTLEELSKIDNVKDIENITAKAYVIKGYFSKTASTRSSTCAITNKDKTSSISLYTNSGNEYDWLLDYSDQELTLEIALCNWNNKKFYKACVIKAYTSTNQELVNPNKYLK